MWRARVTGLLISVAGGSLVGFLWSELMDHRDRYLFIYRVGIPGVLLLAAFGTIAVLFGLYLLLAPNTALRRRPAQRLSFTCMPTLLIRRRHETVHGYLRRSADGLAPRHRRSGPGADDFAAAFPAAPVVQSEGDVRRYVDDEMNVIFEVDVIGAGPGAEAGTRPIFAACGPSAAEPAPSCDRAIPQCFRASRRPRRCSWIRPAPSPWPARRRMARGDTSSSINYAQYQGSDADRDHFLDSFRFMP